MASIDERIVSMVFDNTKFESKAKVTMATLQALKSQLNFKKVDTGIEDVQKSIGGVNFNPMASAIDGISAKFMGLSTVAITALSNITNRAVDAGLNIAKALTVEPIAAGFQEYELNMNSIQTILANTKSKGSTLDDVNAALGELNTYADETIYNFSEMTNSIGQFTAAGVDLDTSTASIKGFSNLAAISGANAQQAAGGMYQMGQAISKGYMGLEDWNSMDTAGVGGEIFKEQLFETAKAMGKLNDVPMGQTFKEWEKESGSFRESLADKWVDADVLTNTLKGFGGDLDEAELKAIGYSDEMIAKTKELGEMGISAAQDVKTMTQLWDTLQEGVGSGWAKTWEIVFGDFEEAKAAFTSVYQTIGPIIDAMSDSRNNLLQGWKDLGGRTEGIEAIKNVFEALMSVMRPIGEAFRTIFPPITAQNLYDITVKVREFTETLTLSGSASNDLKRTFQGVFAVISIVGQVVGAAAKALFSLFGVATDGAGGILRLTANIGDFLVKIDQLLKEGTLLETFFGGLAGIIKAPLSALKAFGGGLDGVTGTLKNWASSALSAVQGALSAIIDWFSGLGAAISDAVSGINFTGAFSGLSVGLLAALTGVMAYIAKNGLNLNFGEGLLDKLKDALGLGDDGLISSIKGSFGALTDTLDAMQTNIQSDTLIKIAAAVGILAASMVVLSTIDAGDLTKALTAMSVGFGQLVAVMAVIGELSSGKGMLTLPAVSLGLMGIAAAMVILAAAVKIFSTMSGEELAKGLGAVALALTFLVTASNKLSPETPNLLASALAMTAISVALILLSKAVKSFGEMDIETLAKGLGSVAVGLGILVAGINLMPTSKLMATGVSLILVATAMNILQSAVAAFGSMSWDELGRGMAGLAGGLLAIALGLKLMPKNMVAISVGLVGVGVAMNLVAKAIQSMGSMSWEEIGRGIVTLGGSLVTLAVGLRLMNGTLVGAAALVVAAAGIRTLVPAIQALGNMSPEQLVTAMVGLAAAFAVLGVAVLALTPLIPSLFLLGAGLALLGVSVALVGAGLLAAATAFNIFLVASTAASTGVGVMLSLLPQMFAAVATGLVTFISTLALGAGQIASALVTLGSALLDGFMELVPKLGEAIGTFLIEILNLIQSLIPEITQTVEVLVLSVLDVIIQVAPRVGEAALAWITAIADTISGGIVTIAEKATDMIAGFLGAIANNIGRIIAAGVSILLSFMEGISTNIPLLVNKGFEMVITLIEGLTQAIRNNSGRMNTAGWDLAKAIIDGMVNGITGGLSRVITSISNLATSAIAKAKEVFGIHSPSREFRAIGGYLGEGLEQGIEDSTPGVVTAMGGMTDSVMNRAKKSFGPENVLMILGSIQEMTDAATTMLDTLEEATPALNNLFGLNLKMSKAQIEELKKARDESLDKVTDYAEKEADAHEKLTASIEKRTDAQEKHAETLKKLEEARKKGDADGIRDAEKAVKDSEDAVRDAELGVVRAERQTEYAEAATTRALEAAERQQKVLDTGKDITDKELELIEASEKAALAQEAAAERRALASEAAEKAARTGLESDLRAAEAYDKAARASEQMARNSQNESDAIAQNINNSMNPFERWGAQLPVAAQNAVDQVKKVLGIASPSKVFIGIGKNVNEGFAKGLNNTSDIPESSMMSLSDRLIKSTSSIKDAMGEAMDGLFDSDVVIRPVVDITDAQRAAEKLSGMFHASSSYVGARIISEAERITSESAQPKDIQPEKTEIKFVQNNTSPTALSTADIYRNTRSQFALAKEALKL